MSAQNGTKWSLLNQGFSDCRERWAKKISVSEMNLQAGKFRIRVRAHDGSWINLLSGNRACAKKTYVLDRTAPRVRLESFRNNLARGASRAVAFHVEGEARRVGVSVGDAFFPAYRQPNGLYLALYAYPYDIAASEESPEVLARDRASNTASATLRCFVNSRDVPLEKIHLDSAFLAETLPAFREAYPGITDKVDLFQAVNERMRRRNRAKLREIGRNTAPLHVPCGPERFSDSPLRRDSFPLR